MDDYNAFWAAATPWLIWLTTGGLPVLLRAVKAFGGILSLAKAFKPESLNGAALGNTGTGGVTSGNNSPVITGNGNTVVAPLASPASLPSSSDGVPAILHITNSGSGTQTVNVNVNIDGQVGHGITKIPGRAAPQRRTDPVRGNHRGKNAHAKYARTTNGKPRSRNRSST